MKTANKILLLFLEAKAVIAAKNCALLVVSVSVSAVNAKFNTLRVDSNIDAVELTRDMEYALLSILIIRH